MLRDRRLADASASGEIADAKLALARQALEHRPAGRIGKGAEKIGGLRYHADI
jgi:hypothetical protein